MADAQVPKTVLRLLAAVAKAQARRALGSETLEAAAEALADTGQEHLARQVEQFFDTRDGEAALRAALANADRCVQRRLHDPDVHGYSIDKPLRDLPSLLEVLKRLPQETHEDALEEAVRAVIARDWTHLTAEQQDAAARVYVQCLRRALIQVAEQRAQVVARAVLRVDERTRRMEERQKALEALIREQFDNLLDVITREDGKQQQRPDTSGLHWVPNLPEHYISREEFLEPLREALLSREAARVGIVGVRGMGGIGKTVLAIALARDPQVQDAFPDGIFWITLGRDLTDEDIIARQEALARALSHRRERFRTPLQGRMILYTLFEGRTALLILDDVWRAEDAEHFTVVSGDSRILITSRNEDALRALGADVHSLNVLTEEQALRLLADWAGREVHELPQKVAREVARECGYLPLALAMVGSFVRLNPESWSRALRRLRNADLEKLRREFPDYPYENLLVALEVSVEALPDHERERYLDLAVFPEDEPIPLAALEAYWQPLGLDEDDVADLAAALVDRSLAQWEDRGALRLHDLQHDYVRVRCGDKVALHRRFLTAYARARLVPSGDGRDEGIFPWHTLPADDPYMWDHLVYHYIAARWWEGLYRLLTSFDYLEARVRATSVYDLEADYRRALATWEGPEEQRRVLAAFEEQVRLQSPYIARAPEYLFPTLYNHLTWLDAPDGPLHTLCEGARGRRHTWLRMVQDPRPAPPPWLRSLEGHTGDVNAVAVTPDGRHVLSASDDGTVKVWDLATGQLLRSLEGHTRAVLAVAVTPDGRHVLSASSDRTLRLWNLETGESQVLFWNDAPLLCVAISEDGKYVVCGDTEGRVWIFEWMR